MVQYIRLHEYGGLMSETPLRDVIQQKYGEAARHAATATGGSGCCNPAAVEGSTAGAACCADPITSNLYSDDERNGLPQEAMNASLGCGNPTALIDLRPGDIVLDLGSGGGIDVLLSARRV